MEHRSLWKGSLNSDVLTTPPISAKRTTTSRLKPWNTKKTITNDIGNPSPGLLVIDMRNNDEANFLTQSAYFIQLTSTFTLYNLCIDFILDDIIHYNFIIIWLLQRNLSPDDQNLYAEWLSKVEVAYALLSVSTYINFHILHTYFWIKILVSCKNMVMPCWYTPLTRSAVFQLDFEIFRTIASFIKISSGHSLII